MEKSQPTANGKRKHILYVGSFNMKESGSGGIGIYHYHPETGAADYIKTVREDIVAGQMFIDKRRGVLYTVDERQENPDLENGSGGRVFAFSINDDTGDLVEINHKSSYAPMPSYLCPDKTGNYLLVCNHSSFSYTNTVAKDANGKYHLERHYHDCPVVLYALGADGSIGNLCDMLLIPSDADTPACLHYIQSAPDGSVFAACARNQNKLHFLQLDDENKRLRLCSTLEYPSRGADHNGYSPRYGVFHPNKPLFYFNSEYAPYITTVKYDEACHPQTLSMLNVTPDIADIGQKKFSLSDLTLSADGKYLYALYRLINVICVFRLDDDGIPGMIQSLVMDGEGPRGLQFSPDGRFLLVANLTSKDILTLKVNEDGTVVQTGAKASGQEYPANMVFYDL